MPVYLMGGSIFILILGLFVFIIVRAIEGSKKQENKELRERLENHEREQLAMWSESQHVEELIAIFAGILKKHGANSEEAKQFRFGTENQKLSQDRAALKAFNKIADILVKAWG